MAAHHCRAERPAGHGRHRGNKGGRQVGFDKERYKRRNEVNQLKHFRAGATRYDKRAYVFHGTVTVATLRLWLRS